MDLPDLLKLCQNYILAIKDVCILIFFSQMQDLKQTTWFILSNTVGAALEQRETDSNNRLVLISKRFKEVLILGVCQIWSH